MESKRQNKKRQTESLSMNQALQEENHRLRQLLIEKEERLNLISNATSEIIRDWNLLTDQIWWNAGLKISFGFKENEIDASGSWWYGRIHPEDLLQVKERMDQMLASGSSQWSEEYRFQKADSIYCLVLDRGYVLYDQDNKPYRMLCSMQDITERKQAEQALIESRQQFKLLSESIPQLIWTATPGGYVDYFNQQWADYTGIEVSTLRGEEWISLFHPQDLPELQRQWQLAIVTGEAHQIEARIKGADGVYRWFLIRALPCKDKEGKVTQWFGTNTDIEKQKVLSEQLRGLTEKLATANYELKVSNGDLAIANDQLSQTNEELDQYVYKVSHDIRSPVASIMGLLDLLRQEVLPEQGQFYVGLMENRINRLDDFIKSVLAHSRSINTQVNVVSVNFEQIIDKCLEELHYYPGCDRLSVVKQLPVAEVFWGDELRLSIVFKNLISNAIKYRRTHVESFLIIKIAIINHEAIITLEDNGQGIGEAYKEKIFTMFFRASERADGSGLGLYIVKQAVERMGGKIMLRSELDKGTLFTIILPSLKPE